jgi:PhnB protein
MLCRQGYWATLFSEKIDIQSRWRWDCSLEFQTQTNSIKMNNSMIEPYLFFGGHCEEALGFYRTAIGAQIDMVMLYKESPMPMPPGMLPPGFENKVMHASFRVGETRIMASDGSEQGTAFKGISLSLIAPTETEADRAFAALAVGGQVIMPMGKTFWSDRFGMLTDRFGLGWMVTVPEPAK